MGSFTDKKIVQGNHRRSQKPNNNLGSQNRDNNSDNKGSFTEETIENDNSYHRYLENFLEDEGLKNSENNSYFSINSFQDDCVKNSENNSFSSINSFQYDDISFKENNSFFSSYDDILPLINTVEDHKYTTRNGNNNKNDETDEIIENGSYYVNDRLRFPDRNNNPYNTNSTKKIIKNNNSDNKGSSTDETDETIYIEDDVCEISLNNPATQKTR